MPTTGDVTHSGVSEYSYIGGVVGDSQGYSASERVYIYNSLNYGKITHSGTSTGVLYLGGIAWYTRYADIENCVSAGMVDSNDVSYIGGIVGFVFSDVSITHCLWAGDVGCGAVKGAGSPVVADTSLVATLNTTTMN